MASSSPGAVAVAAQPPPAPGLLNGAVGHPGGQATIGGPVGGPAVQLRAAAARGDLQEVVRLLGEGAKILPDEEGRTALHFSASAGHADIAAALIIAGAGVNTTDSAGCTALQRAAAEGHLDLVQQLLKHRADVNQQDNGPGNTALHEASWKGFSRCVQALCAVRGADLSLRNHAGFAPLHLACQNGHNQSCRELLLAGCDPDVRNNYGDTPLHTSARYGHAGVTRILVSAECKVSEQNKNGDTALHIAAAMGRRKLTRILLEAGCTKSLRNKQGETARDIATRKELSEILAILNSPVIPMPRNKEAAAGSKNSANNKRKHKKASASRAGRASGRASGRGSGSRSGSRTTGTGTPAAATAAAAPGREAASGAPGGAGWSPYGCHYYPDTTSFPQPRLDSLPAEPLRKGEQYYLDLAGNIRKGPVGVGYTCYCAPFFRHMEQRLDRDKQDLKRHINQAVEGLERRLGSTQGHISHLTRSLAAERARCSQRHLHLQQWLRGVGVGAAAAAAGGLDSDGALAALGVPRARSVDSLLERPPGDALRDAPAPELADDDVGEEIEVLSEGDNTARRKESFLRRGGRGKLPRPRRGLDWDVLAEADKAMAATDPSHGQDPATAHPLLSAARLHSRATTRHDLANLTDLADVAHPELEVLDERVSRWRGQQRRLMLEVARASREIAQLKKVTGRDRIRERGRDRGRPSSGASSELESRNGRDSRGSRGSKGSRGMAASARRLQTLDQVDEAGGGGLSSEPCAGPGYGRSAGPGPTVQYLEAEVHAPPKAAAACSPGHGYGQRSRSQELLRVEPVAAASRSRSRSRSPSPPAGADPPSSPSPTPVPCSGAARAGRWHGVSVTAEDIENWRRLDRLREAREAREAQEDHDSGMINNPDYEVQVEDGIIFSSDLRDLRELRLPPLPQPQQPTAAMRGQPAQAVELPGPARALSSAPPPAAAVLHPKPKFGTPFEVVPFPRSSPATASASASAAGPTPVPLKRAERAAPAGSAHVPLRKSVHDMVARIQNHMLGNLIGRQHKSKEESAPTSAGPASGTSVQPSSATPAVAASPNHGHREMAIDVGDCVQVQARRVQACHREDDSESSDGEEVGDSSRPGLALGVGLGLGPDYENVACWRDDRHLVSELPYRSRTAVYSPDVDPDFLDIPLTNGHGLSINGHGLGINGHGLNGHGLNGHGLNGHSPGLNVHEPDAVGMGNGVRSGLSLNLGLSPAGTPDLELEVHSHHPFHHHYPYTTGSGSGMYSPDHGDSGYSTRLGGSSNSKGTSPSLSGLDSDGLMQNAAPRSAAALNIANAAAAIVHQRHTNASLV